MHHTTTTGTVDAPDGLGDVTEPAHTRPTPDADGVAWRDAPIDGHGLRVVALVFVGMTALYTLVGLAIVHWWDTGAAGAADADLNRWLEDRRTDRLDTVAEIVATTSNTPVKIAIGLLLLPIMLLLFRRWHEWTIVVGALALEVSVFGLSSSLVGRDRPPVEQLDGAPTNSFPSGHIAACTTLYVTIAIVVFLHTRRTWARALAAVLAVAMPAAMIWARLYQGMHYLTDAVAGVLLGLVAAWTLRHVVLAQMPRTSGSDR